MNNYKEFQTFPDIEQASEIIEILESNNIPFQIDDSASKFQVVGFGGIPINKISLLIDEADIEKVNTLLTEHSTDEDHYLYTFSDNDIIDVIANASNWTRLEQQIAQKSLNKETLQ